MKRLCECNSKSSPIRNYFPPENSWQRLLIPTNFITLNLILFSDLEDLRITWTDTYEANNEITN